MQVTRPLELGQQEPQSRLPPHTTPPPATLVAILNLRNIKENQSLAGFKQCMAQNAWILFSILNGFARSLL